MLAEHAVHRRAVVGPLVGLLVTAFGVWRRRVEVEQWALLSWVCEDLDEAAAYTLVAPATPAAIDAESFSRPLDGRTLAVYTMTERLGSAARQGLEKLFPAARIESCDDPDGSDRLKRLARQVDVFVVNT